MSKMWGSQVTIGKPMS